MRRYYEAYDERYQVLHQRGLSWASDVPTPIVGEVLSRLGLPKSASLLELGCGEGRDARPLLGAGWNLTATDLSPEAVAWCQAKDPAHRDRYRVLDCVRGDPPGRWDLVFAVALLHMLTEDGDRQAFFRFLRGCLGQEGRALLCTMGDGSRELRTDPRLAFRLQPRTHPSGPVTVPATTCRIVSFPTLEAELAASDLLIVEKGVTSAPPEFDSLMYVLVTMKK